jgi:hypothetical protein
MQEERQPSHFQPLASKAQGDPMATFADPIEDAVSITIRSFAILTTWAGRPPQEVPDDSPNEIPDKAPQELPASDEPENPVDPPPEHDPDLPPEVPINEPPNDLAAWAEYIPSRVSIV